jgi:hypothetical protein
MKKLLRSKANFGILGGFLSLLLKHDVKIIKVFGGDNDKNDNNSQFNKADLLIKLDDTETALVELQLSVGDDYFHHMLFGRFNKDLTEYLEKESSSCYIKKMYVVNILYSDDLSGSDYIYKSTIPFIGIHSHNQLILTEEQKLPYQYPEYYLIKVNQFDDLIRDSLDEWIYFFKNTEIKDSFSARGLLEAKALLKSEKQEGDDINI